MWSNFFFTFVVHKILRLFQSIYQLCSLAAKESQFHQLNIGDISKARTSLCSTIISQFMDGPILMWHEKLFVKLWLKRIRIVQMTFNWLFANLVASNLLTCLFQLNYKTLFLVQVDVWLKLKFVTDSWEYTGFWKFGPYWVQK
jgi:hypothetical protein